MNRLFLTIATALLGIVVSSETVIAQSEFTALQVDELVSASLIPSIVQQLSHTQVRVDPRPLRPSPEITTFWEVPPEAREVIPSASSSFYADPDSQLFKRRRRILVELNIPETNAVRDFECPSAMHVARIYRGEQAPDKAPGCPSESYESVSYSLPRRGEAGMSGEEQNYPTELTDGIWTVRSVEHSVGPRGGPAATVDYELSIVDGVITNIVRKNQIMFD